MAEIILVHGIDQQQQTADTLEREWIPALAGGVRAAGFPTIADRIWRDATKPGGIETRMAAYGHLFLTPGQQGDDSGDFSGEEAKLAETLALEWLNRAATQATKKVIQQDARRELAYVTSQMGAEQGIGKFARSAINSVAKISWFAPLGMGFAERFVKRALAQVTLYLTDDTIRSAALESVLNLVEPNTRVVIGHSLGSVVAYEAMHQVKQSIPLLITIGSPIGLNTIVYQRLRPQPPSFPLNVQRWVNAADEDDFIAAEPHLEKFFAQAMPAGSIFEGGYTVDNGAEPHNANFYLGKAHVGRAVGQVLSGGRGSAGLRVLTR